MPIRLEYIVSNKKGVELKRFDVRTEAESYDSVICAAEEIMVLIKPLQKKLSLTDDQIDTISEHLAFKSDEVKLALKHIKKPKASARKASSTNATEEHGTQSEATAEKKASRKKSVTDK